MVTNAPRSNYLVLLPLAAAVSATVLSSQTLAEHPLPEVHVEEEQSALHASHSADLSRATSPDSATLLRTIPGASVNSNGALTGIAQYRGLYGDRINVSIDGAHIHSGGPNAMDAPLSYIPASQLQSLSVERGIASVSSGQETLGGHITATSQQGEFGMSDAFEISGKVDGQLQSQNDGRQLGASAIIANQHHKFGVNTLDETAGNTEFDGGELAATGYERKRHNVFYGYQDATQRLNIKAGKNNTGNSGTPALAMDIVAIDTDLASIDYEVKAGDTTYKASASYSNVSHAMDNFSLRDAPMNASMYRSTLATGDGSNFALSLSTPLAGGTLSAGIDQSYATHNADISNPNNAMFYVSHFNEAERNIFGSFVEWQTQRDALSLEAGLRYNRVSMDADEVNTSMTMMGGMMGANTTTLRDNFNNAEREQNDDNVDLVLKAAYQVDEALTLNAGLSRKQRAPSYQERYLWLSMPTTGGLADGRSYVGNIELDSETAVELNLGFDLKSGDQYIGAQVFYREVKDYIQGTETDYMAANMVANMMSGQDALQYNNIDARLFGGEFTYGRALNQQLRLDGVVSLVRGERTDLDDNLYRIAPLSHQLSLTYSQENWQVSAVSELAAEQNKVSDYNNEAASAGYGLLHLRADWQLSSALSLNAGIENLTDKRYADHLAGYNRTTNSDVAVGDRLWAAGRSLNLGMSYQF